MMTVHRGNKWEQPIVLYLTEIYAPSPALNLSATLELHKVYAWILPHYLTGDGLWFQVALNHFPIILSLQAVKIFAMAFTL